MPVHERPAGERCCEPHSPLSEALSQRLQRRAPWPAFFMFSLEAIVFTSDPDRDLVASASDMLALGVRVDRLHIFSAKSDWVRSRSASNFRSRLANSLSLARSPGCLLSSPQARVGHGFYRTSAAATCPARSYVHRLLASNLLALYGAFFHVLPKTALNVVCVETPISAKARSDSERTRRHTLPHPAHLQAHSLWCKLGPL